MIKRIYLSLTLLIFVCGYAGAQQSLILGKELYEQHQFVKALEYFKKATKKKVTPAALEGLANCYEGMHDYRSAEVWYGKALGLDPNNASLMYQYGQMLKINQKYPQAKVIFERYKTAVDATKIKFAQGLVQSCDTATLLYKEMGDYQVSPMQALNSKFSDYGLVYSNSNTVFYSTNRYGNESKKKKKLSKDVLQPYYKVLQAILDSQNTVLSMSQFNLIKDKPFHEATPVFTPKGDTVFFTFADDKVKEGLNPLKIYYSTKTPEGKFSNPQLAPINLFDYSCTHPSISPDGKTLYYVSNQPGGYGKYDIYKVNIAGEWGKPVNLGPGVNTIDDDVFPVTVEDYLYFSSAGHAGLGGLDVFRVKIQGGNAVGTPQNLRPPFNSSYDDFAPNFKDNSIKKGFVSSNRPGGMGLDDIYSFEYIKPLPPVYLVKVSLADSNDANFNDLKDVDIVLNNLTEGTISNKTFFHEDGTKYNILETNKDYEVVVKRPGYLTLAQNFSVEASTIIDTIVVKNDLPRQYGYLIEFPIQLEKIIMNKSFELQNIYYEYNSARLTAEARLELEKLLRILTDNPQIQVQIGSYCDSRGSEEYNKKLSQARAQSVVDFLKYNGIAQNRVYPKGFGESEILNQCKDGVECSEEEHAINRRTTFKIIGELKLD